MKLTSPEVSSGERGVTVAWPTGVIHTVRVAEIDGVAQIVSVEVANRDGSPVTAKQLRAVPLVRLAAVAAPLMLGGGGSPWQLLCAAGTPQPGRDHGLDHFREVAEVVRRSRATRGRGGARVAVARTWSVSTPTADKWIRKAKDYGFLDLDLRKGPRREGTSR